MEWRGGHRTERTTKTRQEDKEQRGGQRQRGRKNEEKETGKTGGKSNETERQIFETENKGQEQIRRNFFRIGEKETISPLTMDSNLICVKSSQNLIQLKVSQYNM